MSSNINPNNIDGAYPVAGQDNNSQGFRDNFTNTKTNFAYAAAEITDLQNKAVLKQALTGTTLNNNMLGSILSNAQLQEMSNTVVNLGTLSGTVGVNYTAGSYQTVTTAGSISIAFSNFTPAGTQDCVLLQVSVTNVAYTMQLPSAVGNGSSINSLEGIQGYDILTSTITFAETGTFVFQFITSDAGSTIYISELTRPRAYYTNDVLIDSATQAANTVTGGLVVTGGVGIGGNLYVGGTIVGNVEIENISSVVGNITAGNLLTSGRVSATGNITGGNILTGGAISSIGNVTAAYYIGDGSLLTNIASTYGNAQVQNYLPTYTGNLVSLNGAVTTTANVSGGNILTGGIVSATGNVSAGNVQGGTLVSATTLSAIGNVQAGNVRTAGLVSATGNITAGNVIAGGISSRYIDVETPEYANITSTNTYSLSNTSSINILIANNTGYTATLNMPSTPTDGQICNFAVHGNTVTLAVGTGTVLPSFAGSTTVGTGYRYIYRVSNTSWYRIG
jgi:hypothetical protein